MKTEATKTNAELVRETYREQGRIEERLRILDILMWAEIDKVTLTEIRKQIKEN
jgi:hypothetical protein